MAWKMKLSFIGVVLLQVVSVKPAKILMLPGQHFSHVNFFSQAGKALTDAGHDTHIFTIKDYEQAVEKAGVKKIIYDVPKEKEFMPKLLPLITKVSKGEAGMVELFTQVIPVIIDFCKDVNDNQELMNLFRDMNFDLLIMDGTIFYSCYYLIPYRLDAKYISLSAIHSPWNFGVPAMPSLEPIQLLPVSNQMSFFERTINIIPHLFITINPFSLLYSKELMEKYAPDKPYKTINQLMTESEITLVNHNVLCAGYPRISAPNYIFIGGASATPPKSLPSDLKKFADSAKKGLIILSLGSHKGLQLFWPVLKPKIMGALKRLPQKAIVQYSADDVSNIPDNVKLVKWLPQNDLIGHPSTKLFITHGGNNGQLEAIYHGVPVLTIPFSGDQEFNAKQAIIKGFGLSLDRLTMNEEETYKAITEIINNSSYSKNIKKCSAITKSVPSAQENIVFWVQHVLDFGGDHLKSPSIDMPLYKIFMLDVLLFLCVVFVLFIFLVYILVKKICKVCMHSKKHKKE